MNENVKQAVKIILDELNGGNRKEIAETIFDTVRRDHRTLQQLFWSSILLAQIQYSKVQYDARNQQSVALAVAVEALANERNWDMGLQYI